MGFVYVVPVKRGANPGGMTADLIMLRGRGNEEAAEGVDRRTRGLCEPALFLDGIRIQQSAFQPIDDLLKPGMLEGIEVYTRFSDAPIQFQTETTCGVVALWTREGGNALGGKRGWLKWAAGLGFFGGVHAFVAR